MVRIPITRAKVNDWLCYETGFEQMHPCPSMVEWMQARGHTYGRDWFCREMPTHANVRDSRFLLEFPDDRALSLFLLRWS
jgi:hypothetical protein